MDVALTKIAGAQRQLDAAIRMFFAGEDELAIHTVAAASYRVLHDLNQKRGKRLVPYEAWHYGTFQVALAFATGTENELPEPLRVLGDNEIIIGLSGLIRSHILKLGKVPDFQDFIVRVPPEEWQRFNLISNFLKHADRDPHKFLTLTEGEELKLISDAVYAYIRLMHHLTTEMRVFFAYVSVLLEDPSGLDDAQTAIFNGLKKLDTGERRQACIEMIDVLQRSPTKKN